MPVIRLVYDDVLPGAEAADWAVLRPVTEEDAAALRRGDGLGLPAPLAQEAARLAARGGFHGRLGECEALPALGLMPPYQAVLLCGLGPAARASSAGAWRSAGVFAARAMRGRGLERLAVPLTGQAAGAGLRERACGLAEGLLLGGYRMPSFASRAGASVPALREAALLAGKAAQDAPLREALERAAEHARASALAVYTARDLTNLPGNLLTPDRLAREAAVLASHYGMACEVLDEQAIRDLGMGGLTAVGQGSANPPRFITIRYDGTQGKLSEIIGLVGKGITFDTGGISLKRPEGMEEMISDMGGAAVLLGLVHVLGRLRPNLHVVIVIPAAENMPSSSAYKPGDILTMMDGQTVEVLNTDAEGRIVLADAILYAKRLGASKLIDIATLTGAVLVSLADIATGAVANDEQLLSEVLGSAREADEKLWAFPSYPEYRDMLRSDVADIRNSTSKDRWAGSITAGWFIGHFAGDTPWVHLDTGGTAWLWEERGTEPKGGTGAMVRTLANWLIGPHQDKTRE